MSKFSTSSSILHNCCLLIFINNAHFVDIPAIINQFLFQFLILENVTLLLIFLVVLEGKV